MNVPIRTWSPYQAAFFDFVDAGTGSCCLIAVAGSGKTTTLVEGMGRMRGDACAAMFNTKAAEDFEKKLARAGHATNRLRVVGTFHKFGRKAVADALHGGRAPRTWVDAVAKQRRVEAEVRLLGDPRTQMPRELQGFVRKLVSLAKNSGIGLLREIDDAEAYWQIVRHHDLADSEQASGMAARGIAWAQAALRLHLDLAPEVIDFDDMIWLPLVMNLPMDQFDNLLIDEAQDTNAARRALARKMLRPGGRLFAVGDPRQAIYGFTGADADSIDLIRREFSATELPLTISYRCAAAIIQEAQQIVNHIEAAPGAEEGLVTTAEYDELLPNRVEGTVFPPALQLGPDDAVLCRKTAPLVKLAFAMIRNGIACHVEGKEIGRGLMALATKWKTPKSIDSLRARLEDYRETEVEKLNAKGQETQAEALADRVETLLVLMEGCPDLACVQAKIDRMFADGAPTLTLSTVHKSKGREWRRVVVLGREEYMPSPWARQDWQQVQEQNLIYVAVTRAMRELVYVSAPPEKETQS